jgi:drug/metabolite transporter (DMT)-like permease
VSPAALPNSRYAGHRSAAGLGLALVLSGSLLLTCSDAIAKVAFERAPLSQYIVLVSVLVLPVILLAMALTRRLPALRIRNRPALSLRAACMVGSTLFFFAGLQRMPLGDIYAIAFTSPIITLPLAAWVLREQVGWRRWSAVLVGFLGVALAILPTGQGYAWTAALFPLGAAACGALRDISSRRLSATDDSLAILFYSVLAVLGGGLGLALFEDWAPLELDLFALIAACALIQTTASLLQIEAYRFAEVSFLAPFRYVVLLFATLLGFIVWGDVPEWNVALGGLIIVASGLFIWYRERKLLRGRA